MIPTDPATNRVSVNTRCRACGSQQSTNVDADRVDLLQCANCGSRRLAQITDLPDRTTT